MIILVKAIHLNSKCVIQCIAAHFCRTQRPLLDIPEPFQERQTQPVEQFLSSPLPHLPCSFQEVLDKYVKIQ